MSGKLILPEGGAGAPAPRPAVSVTIPGQEYTPEQLEIIRATVMPPNATDREVAHFLTVCATVKLDPFSRQIYAVRRQGKIVFQTGVDGYVTLAQRTGRYAGRDAPIWDPTPESGARHPARCTVTVHDTRGGKAVGVALWEEYAPPDMGAKDAFMWRRMPFSQLEKCAFVKALRALFGAETFAGVYAEDEFAGQMPPRREREEDAPVHTAARVIEQEEREPVPAPEPTAEPSPEELTLAEEVQNWISTIEQCPTRADLDATYDRLKPLVAAKRYRKEDVERIVDALQKRGKALGGKP